MPGNSIEKRQNFTKQEEAKMAKEFSESTKDEGIGFHCDLFSAKSGIEGQDGGVVTALLTKGFEQDMFDSAIVVQSKEGYNAEAIEAKNVGDALKAKGTKYLRINMTQKLLELIGEGKKRIAIVCTPCQVKSARKIQQTFKNKCEITIIGLFCFEAFNKDRLKKETEKFLGIDLDKTQKTQILKGKFTAVIDGKEYNCKVKDLDQAIEKSCLYCEDFTSQLADISVGSVGSKRGYSTVIVRSEVGEELLKNLDLLKKEVDFDEIDKLSKFKRERAKKNLDAIVKQK